MAKEKQRELKEKMRDTNEVAPKTFSKTNIRDKKKHWLDLLDLEHANALISDCFWYIICKHCNPQPEFE